MKKYQKPTLEVALFSSQEAVAANMYGEPTVSNETIGGVDTPVTTYEIYSFTANS